jgi:hypothetical protein
VRSAGLTASRSALMRMTLPAQGQRELAGGFDSQFTPVVEDPALHDSGAPLHALIQASATSGTPNGVGRR